MLLKAVAMAVAPSLPTAFHLPRPPRPPQPPGFFEGEWFEHTNAKGARGKVGHPRSRWRSSGTCSRASASAVTPGENMSLKLPQPASPSAPLSHCRQNKL